MSGPIQTYLRLLFTEAGTSVTQDILPDLLSFSYDDKETNEADEISLTLKDPTGKWASKWKPDGGEVVRAYIASGTVDGKKGRELFCGKFFVDSLRTSASRVDPYEHPDSSQDDHEGLGEKDAQGHRSGNRGGRESQAPLRFEGEPELRPPRPEGRK